MRLPLLAAGCAFLTAAAVPGQVAAQDDEATERTIRSLEQAEMDALLRGDLDGVTRGWAEDYTVNNPRHEVGRASETVVLSGRSPDAGQTIRRRFTNVGMMREGRWLLVARHANVVCPD